jgi:FtsP/CotA-like multicopper oxidase with cupredoxin domain
MNFATSHVARRLAAVFVVLAISLAPLLAEAAGKGVLSRKKLVRRAAQFATAATDIYLRAQAFTKTMPDGVVVTMWGFAKDSSFGSGDGVLSSPGPLLTIPAGNPDVVIHLDNNLPVPISLVIPGFVEVGGMTPVRSGGRIVSFTHETAPGNTTPGNYAFVLRPGSFIYQSGSHQAVQVQMGLYGGFVYESVVNTPYTGVTPVNAQVPVFFSEIDPLLHNAVATNNYGPGKLITSTIDYNPQYFLVNGEPFRTTPGFNPNLAAGAAGQRVLIRYFNASLRTVAPVTQGLYMEVIAEDGYKYGHSKQQYSLTLPAMKTIDAIITPTAAGTYPLYDRRLSLTNALYRDGGFLRYLSVAP